MHDVGPCTKRNSNRDPSWTLSLDRRTLNHYLPGYRHNKLYSLLNSLLSIHANIRMLKRNQIRLDTKLRKPHKLCSSNPASSKYARPISSFRVSVWNRNIQPQALLIYSHSSNGALQLHRFITLFDLPEELLDHIIVYICDDFISLKKTRATCRGLARITTPYVFGTVHITLSKKSMENFVNIGLNNALAPLVKELVFHGQIPRKFPNQKTWERYIHLGLEEEGLKSRNPYWYEYNRYGHESESA